MKKNKSTIVSLLLVVKRQVSISKEDFDTNLQMNRDRGVMNELKDTKWMSEVLEKLAEKTKMCRKQSFSFLLLVNLCHY